MRVLKATAILLACAFLAVPDAMGQEHVKSYDVVRDGQKFKTGRFMIVTETGGDDTLHVWLRHVEDKTSKLNTPYSGADEADIVVRCYPKLHPHPNHIFPNSKGEVYMVQRNGSVFFFDETGAKQTYFDMSVVSPV